MFDLPFIQNNGISKQEIRITLLLVGLFPNPEQSNFDERKFCCHFVDVESKNKAVKISIKPSNFASFNSNESCYSRFH